MPRDFHQLPTNVQELIDQYFHREELEARVTAEEEESMSTDTEAAGTVCRLNLQCPKSTESLQVAMREALTPATAPDPPRRNITTTQTIRWWTSMNSTPTWCRGSCSGRPPRRVLPLLLHGVHLISVSKSRQHWADCRTCGRC